LPGALDCSSACIKPVSGWIHLSRPRTGRLVTANHPSHLKLARAHHVQTSMTNWTPDGTDRPSESKEHIIDNLPVQKPELDRLIPPGAEGPVAGLTRPLRLGRPAKKPIRVVAAEHRVNMEAMGKAAAPIGNRNIKVMGFKFREINQSRRRSTCLIRLRNRCASQDRLQMGQGRRARTRHLQASLPCPQLFDRRDVSRRRHKRPATPCS